MSDDRSQEPGSERAGENEDPDTGEDSAGRQPAAVDEDGASGTAAVVVEAPAADSEPDAEPPDAAVRPEQRAGVRLGDGKVFDFDPAELDLYVGDTVVVNNDRDLNLGQICYIVANRGGRSLRKVQRRVGSHDVLLMRRNAKREEEAFEYCQRRIAERKLPMKLVRAVFLHGGNKAIFYFTADGRVDFRALVRDLAQQLHVRIEMRQIGVRDEAKLLGGIGICGQPLCCARYLRKFVPVSIKMAKNQGLALNPQKVSGLCGRLMCCLVYEDDTYRDLRHGFPKQGKTIDTPAGPGKVIETDVLGGRVRVLTQGGICNFTLAQLERGSLELAEEGKAAARREVKAEKPRRREPRSARDRDRGRERSKGRPRKSDQPADRDRTDERAGADGDRRAVAGDQQGSGAGRSRSSRRRRRRKARKATEAGAAPATAAEKKKPGGAAPAAGGEETKPAGAAPAPAGGQRRAEPDASSKRKKRRRRSRRKRKRNKSGGGSGGSDGNAGGGSTGGAGG